MEESPNHRNWLTIEESQEIQNEGLIVDVQELPVERQSYLKNTFKTKLENED